MGTRLLKLNRRDVRHKLGVRRIAVEKATAPLNLPQYDREIVAQSHEDLEPRLAGLPSTVQLLTGGGDSRIVCGPRGRNRYGCAAVPEPDVLAYGSSTASTISSAGFAAADVLRRRLSAAGLWESAHVTYESELDRVRQELQQLCGLGELSGLEIVFGASGTDLHLFASQLMLDEHEIHPVVIQVDAGETGSGVPDALAGRHFSDCAALGDSVIAGAPLGSGRAIDRVEIKCRTADGTLRPQVAIDSDVEEVVRRAAAAGRRILLTLVDVSKTGILAPSPACVDALRHHFPNSIEILVDGCQFRLAPTTLRAYLEHGFLVAITGSKFVTGAPFCGALIIPPTAAARLKTRRLSQALQSYSALADWPPGWAARSALKPVANYGLLLRWQAALTELRAFRRLSEAAVEKFLRGFFEAITQRLDHDPAFELLPTPTLDRAPVVTVNTWDSVPTVFSFLLRRRSAAGKFSWLNQSETKSVYELLREDLGDWSGLGPRAVMALRCQVGQPVACGTRAGIPVSALRLCASARLVVDALGPEGRGIRAVIADAIAVLDKAALLASFPLT